MISWFLQAVWFGKSFKIEEAFKANLASGKELCQTGLKSDHIGKNEKHKQSIFNQAKFSLYGMGETL